MASPLVDAVYRPYLPPVLDTVSMGPRSDIPRATRPHPWQGEVAKVDAPCVGYLVASVGERSTLWKCEEQMRAAAPCPSLGCTRTTCRPRAHCIPQADAGISSIIRGMV